MKKEIVLMLSGGVCSTSELYDFSVPNDSKGNTIHVIYLYNDKNYSELAQNMICELYRTFSNLEYKMVNTYIDTEEITIEDVLNEGVDYCYRTFFEGTEIMLVLGISCLHKLSGEIEKLQSMVDDRLKNLKADLDIKLFYHSRTLDVQHIKNLIIYDPDLLDLTTNMQDQNFINIRNQLIGTYHQSMNISEEQDIENYARSRFNIDISRFNIRRSMAGEIVYGVCDCTLCQKEDNSIKKIKPLSQI